MANIIGTEADEAIVGGPTADVLDGRGGQDTLTGGEGNDTLEGGEGDDQLDGGKGNDRLYGNSPIDIAGGFDSLWGFAGDDDLRSGHTSMVDGGEGIDSAVIDGSEAIDALAIAFGGAQGTTYGIFLGGGVVGGLKDVERLNFTGGDFADSVSGASGNDTLSGGDGLDSLDGGGGRDSLFGGGGGDSLVGGLGDDFLYGLAFFAQDDSLDTLQGGEGNDRMTGGAFAVYEGGAGLDEASITAETALAGVGLNYGGLADTAYTIFVGGAAAGSVRDAELLTFVGSEYNDTVVAAGGEDDLAGGDADDRLDGGEGGDTLKGGSGVDLLNGGAGDDDLYSGTSTSEGADADSLFGGAGADELVGGLYTLMDGGADVDEAQLDAKLAAGAVRMLYGGADGVLYALTVDGLATGAGLRDIESLTFAGGDFDDVVTSSTGNDDLSGGDGADQLSGFAGEDELRGGIGNDSLSGGENDDTLIDGTTSTTDGGADLMEGGAGEDLLIGGLSSIYDGGDGFDTASVDARRAAAGVRIDGADTTLARAIRVGGAAAGSLRNVERFEFVGSDFNDGVTAGAGFDDLSGGAGDDQLRGGAGVDTLEGGAGDDSLTGGDGNDRLYGQTSSSPAGGRDTLLGGNGNDDLYGGVEATYDGGDGQDAAIVRASGALTPLVFAAGGQAGVWYSFVVDGVASGAVRNVEHFVITGGTFGDTLTAAQGADEVNGENGSDLLNGGGGNDRLRGGANDDTLVGGFGNDTLDGSTGVDVLSYADVTGGAGQVINLEKGTATGGGGNDSFSNMERIVGSAFADEVNGFDKDDHVSGGAGADTLRGGKGDDTLDGGDGGDSLDGGEGVDTLSFAGSSAGVTATLNDGAVNAAGETDVLLGFEVLIGSAFGDSLRGDAVGNLLQGGDGNDTLLGMLGDDTLSGGVGADVASYFGAAQGVTVDLALSGAQDTGGAGQDTLISIEGLTGSNHADVLLGDGGTNEMRAFDGNDLLEGRGGADRLSGQNGADTLVGGAGRDQLTGGSGADVFRFTALADSAPGKRARDTVDDFDRSQGDKIDISGIDAKTGGADDAFAVVSAFTNVAGQLRLSFDGARALVEADVNGDGRADFAIVVNSTTALVAGDFLL